MDGGRGGVGHPPRHWVRKEPFLHVILREQLHPDNGKYINHDDEDECQVTQGAYCRNDDAQEDLHRGPGLRQLENA